MNLRSPAARGQEGAVMIIVAVVLAVLGALLVSVQMGYDYLQEQRLQKAADLAALSAVQVLGTTFCDQGLVDGAAAGVAGRNGAGAVSVAGVACGRWAGRPDPVFTASNAGTQEEPLNAVQVRTSIPVVSLLPGLLGSGRDGQAAALSAVSTAAVGRPVATFSVAAQLLSLQPDGLVANILKPIGLDANELTVLSSAGLANFNVTPGGLLHALGLPATVLAGIGTEGELAKLHSLKLGDLLDAYGEIVGQVKPAGVDLAVLDSALAKIEGSPLNVPVSLFGTGGVMANLAAGGVPDLATTLPSALNAQVGLASLIGSSILVANGTNFVKLDASVVPGLASLETQVVSPPTIVTGPVGTAADNVQTQFKLGLDVSLLPGLITVDLPVYLGVGSSRGTLDAVSFDSRSATFDADVSTADLCIGTLPADGVCNVETQPAFVDFVKVNLLLLSVTVQVRANIPLVACTNCGSSVDVPVGEGRTVIAGSQGPKTRVGAGDIKTNLVASVLGIPFAIPLEDLLNPLVKLLNGMLTPLLQNVVAPMVGTDLNGTDIHLYSITRGAPYLVR